MINKEIFQKLNNLLIGSRKEFITINFSNYNLDLPFFFGVEYLIKENDSIIIISDFNTIGYNYQEEILKTYILSMTNNILDNSLLGIKESNKLKVFYQLISENSNNKFAFLDVNNPIKPQIKIIDPIDFIKLIDNLQPDFYKFRN